MSAIHPYIQWIIIIAIISLVVLLFESINIVISFIGSALIVSIISWKFNEIVNRYLGSKRVIGSTGKAVIITGCDSGFGNGLAFKLNQLGFHTIAICLDASSDGAKHLLNRVVFPNRLSVIQMDVTQGTEIDHSFEDINGILRDNGLKLWALVNNAGVFHFGFVEWDNNIDGFNRTLNVNTLGAIRMTRKYLPLLRESGGRVVNMLSAFSRIAVEGTGAYSASKFASLAFNESLRREVLRFGLKVISVEPSCYRTPLAHIQTVHSLLDNVWSRTAPNVRQDYGTKTFEKLKTWYKSQTKRARDPSEVVSALTEAVVSETPQIRYRCCGLLFSIMWFMGELIPSQMLDDLIRFVDRFELIME